VLLEFLKQFFDFLAFPRKFATIQYFFCATTMTVFNLTAILIASLFWSVRFSASNNCEQTVLFDSAVTYNQSADYHVLAKVTFQFVNLTSLSVTIDGIKANNNGCPITNKLTYFYLNLPAAVNLNANDRIEKINFITWDNYHSKRVKTAFVVDAWDQIDYYSFGYSCYCLNISGS
jgi:hypothetical protein